MVTTTISRITMRRRSARGPGVAALASLMHLATTFPAAAAPPSAPALGAVESYHLANGLTVRLQEDHHRPRIGLAVSYRVGSRDDPEGYEGLAHLVEHLMFRRSAHMAQESYFVYLDAAGATEATGFTTPDETTYYEVLPSSQLPLGLWLESERMAFLLGGIGPEDLERERNILQREREQRTGTYAWQTGIRVMSFVYSAADSHPYRNIGRQDLEAIDLGSVQWFFQHWYQPSNATVALVGDFSTESAKISLERYFGGVRSTGPGVARAEGRGQVVLDGEHVRKLSGSQFSREAVAVGWPIPAQGTEDAIKLALLGDCLGMASSPFYKGLTSDGSIAMLRVGLIDGALGSVFVLEAELSAGASIDAVRKMLDERMRRLREDASLECRLEDLMARDRRALMGIEGAFGLRAVGLAEGRPVETGYDRRGRVTLPELSHAARRWLPEHNRAIVLFRATS
jgi:zinc protease